MTRKVLLIVWIVGLVFTQVGCWDRREVENLGIVNGIAIESSGEHGVRIVVQTVNTAAVSRGTSGGGGGLDFDKAYRNLVVEGDNLYDAIKHLALITSNQRFFAHTEIIVISEDLARTRGVEDVLDYLTRDPQWRFDIWLLIGRGDMRELMDTKGVLQLIPAQRIGDILKLNETAPIYAPNQLGEFVRILSSGSIQPYTAVVEIQPNLSAAGREGTDILSGEVPETPDNLVLNGTAVFQKDKMVGWLNESESRGLLFIKGEVRQGQLKFPNPDDSNNFISTEILQAKTKLKPELVDNQVIMHIDVNVASALEDVEGRVLVSDKQSFDALEKAQEQAVTESIQAALSAAQQEYKVDVFGFGEAVHRTYPQHWKEISQNWPDLFPEVQTEITVTSTILHSNLISDPLTST